MVSRSNHKNTQDLSKLSGFSESSQGIHLEKRGPLGAQDTQRIFTNSGGRHPPFQMAGEETGRKSQIFIIANAEETHNKL